MWLLLLVAMAATGKMGRSKSGLNTAGVLLLRILPGFQFTVKRELIQTYMYKFDYNISRQKIASENTDQSNLSYAVLIVNVNVAKTDCDSKLKSS